MFAVIKRTVPLTCVALLLALLAFGCNTLRGVGKDIESAGRGIQNASDKVSDEISN